MTELPTNPDGEPIRRRPWHESLEIFISKNFWRLVGVGLIGIGLFWWFNPELPPVPREANIVFWTAVLGSPLSYILAARTVDMLHDPWGVILLDLDARETGLAIWNIPRKRWKEIEVTEGDLFRAEAGRTVYCGRNYDPEAQTIEGTWRGSASDLELLRRVEKIDEIRGQLEDFAKRGFAVHVRRSTIVRSAVRDISMAVIRSLESNIVFGGDRIEEAVDRAVSRYDFDTEASDNADEDENKTPDPTDEPIQEPFEAAADGGTTTHE